MRLIEAATLQLCDFVEGHIPPYACLSHRWSTEEVSYQQWCDKSDEVVALKGYVKVVTACEVALGHGIKYVWADTCCIDKTSSAELSEAINSMWTWYMNCQLCLAHLADVAGDDSRGPDGYIEKLDNSEWFERAWTLQELLAPASVLFYDTKWRLLGSKQALVDDIHQHTKIHPRAITHFRHSEWSIAQRMSWASSRQATRTEDIAYSLLGIFDINMPMLYGEGKKAFARLQAEIIRNSIDTSILAWDARSDSTDEEKQSLLAPSPSCFNHGRRRTGLFSQLQDLPNAAHLSILAISTITNLGLETSLPLTPLKNARRHALVAFEASPRRGREPQFRKGCFLCLDHIHGNDFMQRSPFGLNSQVLASLTQMTSEDFKIEWQKITIASKPYQRAGLAQDRFSLKPYMVKTGPSRNICPSASDSEFINAGIMRATGSTPYETIGIWWSADNQSPGSSYLVRFGFDAGHSPMFFINHVKMPVGDVEEKVNALDERLFTVEWMQQDFEMTQHESKAFSWVDHNKDGDEGVVLHFYSRRGFKIQWKAVALQLDALAEDETGLEWSLGMRNIHADTESVVSPPVDIDYVLRSGEGLISSVRQIFTATRFSLR